MTDAVQRGLITVLSAWLLLHESAHEVIEEFVEKGTLPQRDDDGLLGDLSRQVTMERDHLKAWLRSAESGPQGRAEGSPAGEGRVAPPASADRREIDELLARMDRLEGQIAVLDSRLEALAGDEPGRR